VEIETVISKLHQKTEVVAESQTTPKAKNVYVVCRCKAQFAARAVAVEMGFQSLVFHVFFTSLVGPCYNLVLRFKIEHRS